MADTVRIAFGRGHLEVRLPDGAQPTLIRKRQLAKLPDPHSAVRAALDAGRLREHARGKHSACILICDITRSGAQPAVPAADDRGPGRSRHPARPHHGAGRDRPAPAQRRRRTAELVGDEWVLANVRVENHFARDDDDHIDLGLTRDARHAGQDSTGASRRPDLRIATGLVEPHFMAGWSGGRKVVAPGVAGHETIRTFHSARFMEDPLAVQCNLIGNPLHEEQLEIVRMLGDCYALNIVIDEDRDLVCATFGEIIASHQAAVDFVATSTARAGRPAIQDRGHLLGRVSAGQDLLPDGQGHGDAARHPRARRHADHRLGMFGRLRIERVPRGAARLVSLGPERFLATLTAKSLAEVDEWQTEMQLKAMRLGRVQLYTTGTRRGGAADHWRSDHRRSSTRRSPLPSPATATPPSR